MRRAFRWWVVPLAAAALAVSLGATARAADEPREGHDGADEKVYALLRDVINEGVELYDARDYAGCYRLWEGSLKTLRPFFDHRKEWQKAIDDGLAAAQAQPVMWQRDWALRRVMDRIRDEIHPPKRGEAATTGTTPGATGGEPRTGGAPPAPRPGGTRVMTLWDRLGGEEGVGKVIDQVVAVAAKDPKVDFLRGGKYKFDKAQAADFRKQMIDWVSAHTGGPFKYTGKSMKETHKGMGITDAQFDALAADIKGVLEKGGVRPDDITAVMGAVESTRQDIVEKKSEGETKPEEKKPGESKEDKKEAARGGTVTGKVTFKGKPLPGGTITFVPEGGKSLRTSPIGADGSYKVEGLATGKATILVETASAKGEAGKYVAIPEKYDDPAKSGLTVEVKEGNQTHDIDLE